MTDTILNGTPSSKEKKYDRQLRLWGSNGQNKLEATHIALFGASATGCEILKNLVLPGGGQFTVIDDKKVEVSDLGVNFFLDEDSLGKSRAERASAFLGELNPDVKGCYIEDNLSNFLDSNPELFMPGKTPFTHIIVVSPFTSSAVIRLSPEIPTFLVYSIGFTIALRIAAPTQCIVETHSTSLTDLRLLNPWEELLELALERTKDLDIEESCGGMSDHEHGHVPYVFLLIKYLEDWKASHDGKYPSDYKEKNEFKSAIMDKMRTNVPGGSEENYEEAVAVVLKHVRETELSPDTRAVLEDPRCKNPEMDSDNFWTIAHAVQGFVSRPDQGGGFLPLSGGLPDMKAESNTYLELQKIYRNRALRDASLVHENVKAILTKIGRHPESIGFDEVSLFCKNSNFIRRINFRSIASEYATTPDAHHAKTVLKALSDWDSPDSLVHDYIAIRAWQKYYSNTGKLPGVNDAEMNSDLDKIKNEALEYLKSLGYNEPLGERTAGMLQEVVRSGGGELHVTAAMAGGIVAQEIIKVITGQYIPLNNTVIFDGISSRSSVFEF